MLTGGACGRTRNVDAQATLTRPRGQPRPALPELRSRTQPMDTKRRLSRRLTAGNHGPPSSRKTAGRNPPLSNRESAQERWLGHPDLFHQCSRGGTLLLPSVYADACYVDAAIVFKAPSTSTRLIARRLTRRIAARWGMPLGPHPTAPESTAPQTVGNRGSEHTTSRWKIGAASTRT